jgi:DNA polymerase III sliding clamp (beta) subunit (PCNA family)
VPLSHLKELANGNGKEMIEFETADGATITVTNHVGTQSVKHPLNGMALDDWPVCPAEIETKPAAGFLETYRRLVPFASSASDRYLLNGVYIDVAEKGEHPVTMVATDGRRLSLWNSMNLPLPMSVIVPTTKFLQWKDLQGEAEVGIRTVIDKAKKKGEEDRVRVLEFAVRTGPWTYDVKAIEGTYPNFRQVIPAQIDAGTNRITFTDEDVESVRKILPTFPGHDDRNDGITLSAGKEGRLAIVGRGPDDKKPTTLELTGGSRFEGALPGIGVNRAFLLDALHAGFRCFTATDGMSPLKSVDGKGGVHVLMPLRLGNEPVRQPEAESEPRAGSDGTGALEQRVKTEMITPAVPPAEKPKGELKTMKEGDGSGTIEQGSALDKVLASVETAKAKLKEAVTSLSEVADAVKVAVKESKSQAGDLEKARTTLQKLQAISL